MFTHRLANPRDCEQITFNAETAEKFLMLTMATTKARRHEESQRTFRVFVSSRLHFSQRALRALRLTVVLVIALILGSSAAFAQGPSLGKPISPAEIAAWDI